MTKAKQSKTLNAPRNGSIVPNRRRGAYNTTRYTNVSDPIVESVYATPMVMQPFTTNGSGITAGGLAITAAGITTLDSFGTPKQVIVPVLPWLFNTSKNFAKYRIVKATLIVVGNVGSSVPGTVAVHSSTDVSDLGVPLSAVATGGDLFELAGLASRNRRIPLHINNAWRPVSGATMRGNIIDSSMQLTPINTMDDLLISVVNVSVAGAPASTNVLSLYIEYDIEFANPISVSING